MGLISRKTDYTTAAYCAERTNRNCAPLQKQPFAAGVCSTEQRLCLELVLDLMRKNRIPANKAQQSWMLDKVLEMLDLQNDNLIPGKLYEDDFIHAYEIIRSQHDADFQLEYNDFFKPALKLPQSN